MGAFYVRFGPTSQSYVDPYQPDLLMFQYVAHIALILENSVLRAPADERLRFVHIGGAGMTIPRFVAHVRPGTAQVVCEPDVELTEEVRRKIPLPPRSGIKVRDVDGRTGLAAMPAEWADVIIVDAFNELVVPGDLVTDEPLLALGLPPSAELAQHRSLLRGDPGGQSDDRAERGEQHDGIR